MYYVLYVPYIVFSSPRNFLCLYGGKNVGIGHARYPFPPFGGNVFYSHFKALSETCQAYYQ